MQYLYFVSGQAVASMKRSVCCGMFIAYRPALLFIMAQMEMTAQS